MDNISIGEVIALSKVFGGGGGSSGGGVMVVNGTLDQVEGTVTLDKTWQEIFDSTYPLISFTLSPTMRSLLPVMGVAVDPGGDYVVFCDNNIEFVASTADDYPVTEMNGGGNDGEIEGEQQG